MIYRIKSITEDVRVCIDENVTSMALLSSEDVETLTLDELICAKIVEAVEVVHNGAPYYKLDTGINFENADGVGIHWDADDTTGWLQLPSDFMRLVVFQMSDWERPVYSMISADSVEYQKQRSRYKGIRGTAQRPVCALGVRPIGKVLEFYSCKTNQATVSRAVYMPYPTIETDTETQYEIITISRPCYEPVIYMAAGLTLATRGEVERSSKLIETATNYLQK